MGKARMDMEGAMSRKMELVEAGSSTQVVRCLE